MTVTRIFPLPTVAAHCPPLDTQCSTSCGREAHGLRPTTFEQGAGGGGGIAVREGQIQLQKNCGKLREKCGAVTKPPEASRSNTSAQVWLRAFPGLFKHDPQVPQLQYATLNIAMELEHEPKAGGHGHPICAAAWK